MALRMQAVRAATVAAPSRVAFPRTQQVRPLKTARPALLQSEFLKPVAALKGLCMTFASERRGPRTPRSPQMRVCQTSVGPHAAAGARP